MSGEPKNRLMADDRVTIGVDVGTASARAGISGSGIYTRRMGTLLFRNGAGHVAE